MTKLFCLVVLAFVAQGLLSSEAAGQALAPECFNPVYCGAYSIWNTACLPPMPSNAFNCSAEQYAFTSQCLVPAKDPKCAPPHPSDCPNGGRPISLCSGNTYIVEVDVRNPGLGGHDVRSVT